VNIQKSFLEDKGILYIVPTPIGNLEDMTFRAIRILKEVDLIAAEDTRNTKKLMNYFDITTKLTSYHEHNKESSGKYLIEQLLEGKTIALVSDAGMPAISDPGYELVHQAVNKGIPVVSIPGANAALTALTASGIRPQPFYFYGFLSRKKKERDDELKKLKAMDATLIFYEAPHRLTETVQALYEVFGERQAAICRELTKKYEEFIRGSLAEMVDWVNRNEIRGEFCIVVEGNSETDTSAQEDVFWHSMDVIEHVDYYINLGYPSKEAIKKAAKDRGLQKRDVYHLYHVKKRGEE
jgi:16S rRNA (cytidine1402-2'-O)-methyltransferase